MVNQGGGNVNIGVEERGGERARIELPVGYRFCPTDFELVSFYLKKRLANEELPISSILDVNVYDDSPEKLADTYEALTENRWYFFTSRNRKYKHGTRPNRAAGGGFWKATGKDYEVRDKEGNVVGYRRALVFYMGSPPGGLKTDWIMHEFRTTDPPRPKRHENDMTLDDSVLCRIYKKPERRAAAVEEAVEAAAEAATAAAAAPPPPSSSSSSGSRKRRLKQKESFDYEIPPPRALRIQERSPAAATTFKTEFPSVNQLLGVEEDHLYHSPSPFANPLQRSIPPPPPPTTPNPPPDFRPTLRPNVGISDMLVAAYFHHQRTPPRRRIGTQGEPARPLTRFNPNITATNPCTTSHLGGTQPRQNSGAEDPSNLWSFASLNRSMGLEPLELQVFAGGIGGGGGRGDSGAEGDSGGGAERRRLRA